MRTITLINIKVKEKTYMSTTYIHTRIGVIDAAGDTNILYPQTTAQDVSVSRSNNSEIPNTVSNIQGLADALVASAFAIPIDDSSTSSTTKSWSANKINSALTQLNSNANSYTDGKVTIINKEISKARKPINLLTISKAGVVTSDYGYTLADLHNMINSANYDDYLKNEDTITVTTSDDQTHVLQANIDTYLGYGNNEVGHHIDFIGKDLINDSYGVKMRTENKNNGTSSIKNPYLASNESGCVLKFLETYLTKIPSVLQNYLTTKTMLLPYRQSDSSATLTDDNGWDWGVLPKLWIPFEGEVSKSLVWSTKGYGNGGCHHYPIFDNGRNIVKRHKGSRSRWWLASALSGNSTDFCSVGGHGNFRDGSASGTWLAIPLCMRFV